MRSIAQFFGLVALVFLACDIAEGAIITWTSTIVDTTAADSSPGTGFGDASVSTNGVLVEAANFGTLTDVTVNGVLFNGVGFTASNFTNDLDNNWPNPNVGTTTGGTIDTLTAPFARNLNDSTSNGTLTGLIDGRMYEVQLISAIDGLNRTMTFNDGMGNSIVTDDDVPQAMVTGTFTAIGTTQALNFNANTGSSFLSAYQLRDVTVTDSADTIPEPATIILASLALFGMWVLRRQCLN
jgi:hypothetical protein